MFSSEFSSSSFVFELLLLLFWNIVSRDNVGLVLLLPFAIAWSRNRKEKAAATTAIHTIHYQQKHTNVGRIEKRTNKNAAQVNMSIRRKSLSLCNSNHFLIETNKNLENSESKVKSRGSDGRWGWSNTAHWCSSK